MIFFLVYKCISDTQTVQYGYSYLKKIDETSNLIAEIVKLNHGSEIAGLLLHFSFLFFFFLAHILSLDILFFHSRTKRRTAVLQTLIFEEVKCLVALLNWTPVNETIDSNG